MKVFLFIHRIRSFYDVKMLSHFICFASSLISVLKRWRGGGGALLDNDMLKDSLLKYCANHMLPHHICVKFRVSDWIVLQYFHGIVCILNTSVCGM